MRRPSDGPLVASGKDIDRIVHRNIHILISEVGTVTPERPGNLRVHEGRMVGGTVLNRVGEQHGLVQKLPVRIVEDSVGTGDV
jgi:hypothetical protein